MAKDEIIEKLRKEISKDTFDESHVVYILTRIRKYLEHTEQRDTYPYLWFYCNWALHPKIDRKLPLPVETMLGDYFRKKDGKQFWDFDHLNEDLKEFLKSVELPTDIVETPAIFNRFKSRLLEIYSSTPVHFRFGPFKGTLTVHKSGDTIKFNWHMLSS